MWSSIIERDSNQQSAMHSCARCLYLECLVDALKALESVIKSICNSKGWAYPTTDSTMKLLDIIVEKDCYLRLCNLRFPL
jgi:hypothetical protein